MRRLRSLMVLCGVLLAPAAARAEEWSFTTLEWPPFSGSLPQGGAITTVLRAAFGTQGHSVRITILPWKRAVAAAMQADGPHVGFFTATAVECSAAGGILSDQPIGHFRYALAQRQELPVRWNTPADLDGLLIGVVDGYDNGPIIEDLLRQGRIRLDAAPTDAANLRKLQAGRTDAAVVEISQYAYLKPGLERPNIGKGMSALTLNERPLGPPQPLHACFNGSQRAMLARTSLLRGLEQIDSQALAQRYVESLGLDGVVSN
ncbi:MAG: substrate-binding periplasmic protein [Niveispirillum sp.]|uniref:substrate-binding periplasmic protein n=1 Tax=Niveispirillum sp. TaxID=1917217 RepID=UPI003BA56924